MHLFSYGSNNTTQLKQRTGSFTLNPISGYIQDYVRIFAGDSKIRNGGIASIYPLPGKRVYGSLIYLTNQELKKLDKYENGYERVVMKINVSNKKTIDSYVYIRKNYMYDKPPSEEYLRAIRLNLDEIPRIHKKIMIRGIVIEDGKEIVKTFGSFPA